jgi:hypothetical protein
VTGVQTCALPIYVNNPYFITASTNIWTPFAQNLPPTTQDYIAAGMLALAGNDNLTYQSRVQVENELVTQFGNGTSGTIQNALTSGDGFNDSLTLWGLTVYDLGNTPLQAYIVGLKTTASSSTSPSSIPAIPSISRNSSADEVKAIVSSKIQAALAAQGSAKERSVSAVAALLGVSKSNLSKAVQLAPAGVKSSNGKISLSKLNKFISRNSKAANILSGKLNGGKKGKKSGLK